MIASPRVLASRSSSATLTGKMPRACLSSAWEWRKLMTSTPSKQAARTEHSGLLSLRFGKMHPDRTQQNQVELRFQRQQVVSAGKQSFSQSICS